MIIPDNLSPFPVLPVSSDVEKAPRAEIDGFVTENAIREILVGPMLVTPLVTARIPKEESFAGRDDLSVGDDDSPFVSLSSDEAYVDEASEEFEPDGPHPALAEPRHAAPPVPRTEPGKGLRHHHRSERWWVLGMGVAMLAVLGLGTLIQLVSNEAGRRSRISQTADQVKLPAITLPGSDKSSGHQPLAASNPEYPAP